MWRKGKLRLKRRLRKCDDGSPPREQARAGGWSGGMTGMVIKVLSSHPRPRSSQPQTKAFPSRSQDPPLEGAVRGPLQGGFRPCFLTPALPRMAPCLPALNPWRRPTFPYQSRMGGGLGEQGWSVEALLGFGGQQRSARHLDVQSTAQSPSALAHQHTAENQLSTLDLRFPSCSHSGSPHNFCSTFIVPVLLS